MKALRGGIDRIVIGRATFPRRWRPPSAGRSTLFGVLVAFALMLSPVGILGLPTHGIATAGAALHPESAGYYTVNTNGAPPVGVAATTGELLFTEAGNCHKIFRVENNPTETVVTFGSVPKSATGYDASCQDSYLAISPGFAGFTTGSVFLSQNGTIYEFGPHGGTGHFFADLAPTVNLGSTLAFDNVGTWGFDLLASSNYGSSSDPMAYLDVVDASGVVSPVNSVTEYELPVINGITVAPLNYGAYAGYALLTNTTDGEITAVAPNMGGVVSFANWATPVSPTFVPTRLCGAESEATDGGGSLSYFVADTTSDELLGFTPSEFSGLSGTALITNVSGVPPPSSEVHAEVAVAPQTGIGELNSSGVGSYFASTTDDLLGSAFVLCPAPATIVATVTNSTWIDPYEMAYDPENQLMYVSDNASDQVYFFNSGSTVVGNATVGLYPTGIAYDPANDEMMVADSGSDAVSYLDASTNTVLGLVPVGLAPEGLAYDSNDQDMYVANNGSNSLTLIGPGNTPAGTVTGVTAPFGLAYDAPVNELFVAEYNGSVAVVRGTSVLGYIPVGGNLTNVAVNGEGTWKHAFAALYNGTSVARVWRYPNNGTVTEEILTIGLNPFGIAFDAATGDLWVSDHGSGAVTILLGPSKVLGMLWAGEGIWGVTYDPANGLVYIAGAIQGDPRVILGGGT